MREEWCAGMHANSRCLVRVIFSLGVYVSFRRRADLSPAENGERVPLSDVSMRGKMPRLTPGWFGAPREGCRRRCGAEGEPCAQEETSPGHYGLERRPRPTSSVGTGLFFLLG